MTTDPYTRLPDSDEADAVVDDATQLARKWLSVTAEENDKATEQLADLLRSDQGIKFTMDFVDRVMRPESDKTAADALNTINQEFDPVFLGQVNAILIGAGAFFGPILPKLVMPLARMRMRQMVGHLVLDAESETLNQTLDKAKESGEQLNLNLLGEMVLGEDEAKRRTDNILALIRNPRVTYVSVKASSVVAQINEWDIDGSVERLKDRLRPLYKEAAKRDPQVFINMDMEEYHDLHLTIRLFKELVSEPEFKNLETGIVLQAYLPDSFAAMHELAEFAKHRVAEGGAPIKIRLVKGANLSMEHVQGEIHNWPVASYVTKAEVDANYYRMLDLVVRKEYADCLRFGVATHNLYTAAFAYHLGVKRGVLSMLDSEMLQGMSPAQQAAVRSFFDGRQILYTPVVHMDDFDVAVSYLVRRLEENSESQNFLYALFAPEVEGNNGRTPLEDQETFFRNAVAHRWDTFAAPRREQNRKAEIGTGRQAEDTGRFVNEPDTDPALQPNREWALEALANNPGKTSVEEVTDVAVIDNAVARAKQLSRNWAAKPADERARVLEKIGDKLADHRNDLISVAAWEANKTVTQTDPEVSEAIDFCVYYGHTARQLDKARSKFTPNQVSVVVPPWNFPIAIPTGGITSSLAAGSAVIIKPAPQVVHCAEVVVNCIHEALDELGLDRDLVQLVFTDEGDAGKALISHDEVDAVILTGASETGQLFRSWDPKMNLMAETSGKNSLIITPSADPDLAINDLYQSAFGHSGQKCSASSLVIFVGSAGESDRLRNQLLDAVRTLKVGYGKDIETTMNGLSEPPSDKLKRGLTQLEPGEKWLLKPKQLDEDGLLWTPGVRDNVQPNSWYHLNECFGPVLGIMYAKDLDEAIKWQNSTGFGLTGGIHSLDDDEIAYWMERVEVGNAYVNRGITGAIVQRQPFGGWKKSVMGPGAKAGGPNYVAQMGTWEDGELKPRDVDINAYIAKSLRQLTDRAHSSMPQEDIDWLWRAAELDQLAWQEEFGRMHDRTGLVSEANLFRYKPFLGGLRVRVGENYRLRDVMRQLLAAARAGVDIHLSARAKVARELAALGIEVREASTEEYAQEVANTPSTRVRALGDVEPQLREAAVESNSVVLDQPVLADGRREMLPFLLEQAVTVTMHRFGIIRETGRIERRK